MIINTLILLFTFLTTITTTNCANKRLNSPAPTPVDFTSSTFDGNPSAASSKSILRSKKIALRNGLFSKSTRRHASLQSADRFDAMLKSLHKPRPKSTIKITSDPYEHNPNVGFGTFLERKKLHTQNGYTELPGSARSPKSTQGSKQYTKKSSYCWRFCLAWFSCCMKDTNK